MLFGTSTIFWQRSHGPVVNIFRDSCFKIGQFQPSVAYKSVAYKKKRVERLIYEVYFHQSWLNCDYFCHSERPQTL